MESKLKLPRYRFLGENAFELKKKLEDFEIESVIFDGVTSEPTDIMVEEGCILYQANQCDFLIGFGGGSQLDTAKAVGAMLTNPGKISDYNGKEFKNELPFLVEIPSTAGTGSETTQVTIITDTKNDIKMLLKGAVLMPDVAVVDPTYSVKVPANITAWTGLDALTHAIEAYTSKKAFPECDTYALSAIKRIFENLPVAYQDGRNSYAREQMSLATYEAGITICNSTVTLVHGMSRPVGAVFHIPHGLSNAMLLKECLTFAMDGAVDRFADISRRIGKATISDSDEKAAIIFLDALEQLCETLHIPTMTEYGVNQYDFMNAIPKMAKDAKTSGSPDNTRKKVTIDDMETIYHKLFIK